MYYVIWYISCTNVSFLRYDTQIKKSINENVDDFLLKNNWDDLLLFKKIDFPWDIEEQKK